MSKDVSFSKDLDKIIRQFEKDEIKTLRDQFAMAALPAVIHCKDVYTVTQAAEIAYHAADAMLKAREAK